MLDRIYRVFSYTLFRACVEHLFRDAWSAVLVPPGYTMTSIYMSPFAPGVIPLPSAFHQVNRREAGVQIIDTFLCNISRFTFTALSRDTDTIAVLIG
jgi:hypothetical protein